MEPNQKLLTVSEAVASRRACRDFLPKEVSLDLIKKILNEARRAPSAGNLQPWKIYLIHGKTKQKLSEILQTKFNEGAAVDLPLQFSPYPYMLIPHPGMMNTFQQNLPKYYSRYQTMGKEIYTAQNVARGDVKARLKAASRTFNFWGAPMGLIFTIDTRMGLGQYPDLGIMLQTVMLLCEQYGLSTCSAVAWSLQHESIRRILNIDPSEVIFCGMAIGYQNKEHKVNQFRTERMGMDELMVIPQINDDYTLPSATMFKIRFAKLMAQFYLEQYWYYIAIGAAVGVGCLIRSKL